MPCYLPFNRNNLDISFIVLRPVGVFTDELISTMKYFSLHAEDFGCLSSSLFKSIHGNLVVWYGAWIKRSTEDRKTLADNLVAALSQITHLAILLNHGFFEAYVGESKDGRPAAKFSTGDILFLVSMPSISNDTSDLSYACLALLRSHFSKEGSLSSTVCLQCKDQPMVATLQVWESLQACYSWLLSSDYRNTYMPYISPLTCDTQFDIFKVVYVSSDEVPHPDSFQHLQGGVCEQR
ncbi:uncharacterized protein LOC120250639 [Dioscorea cayenensis subsp. rotundata]|uniref:Uncharacterized protein LOC120250639 n=1 Tax=Dioscorea cayennensis subsp. rotundata TaxID=55577 RepID=A0AB40AKA2_DIOCR|nr:uncharacterized protein LOC120250639 [Dioscorea cayenensis subsp. rotundata]